MEQSVFATRLAELLEKKRITQKELSERVGVTEATMSRYMHSERIPKAEILANIATALNTTSDYLLGTEEKSNIENDYPRIVRLIARNSANMTQEQKNTIIKALLEDD
ncbi:MAG: helix-turn-helix transcriptional regulator [Oscillospiraceae bacterium]|nr:helix-turn-helix transcriptional regulator [Oscillospiraceae bacterium]MBR4346034.1 helix-turn-helix transcriptional regulator [Oscillospiraceae bacterium]